MTLRYREGRRGGRGAWDRCRAGGKTHPRACACACARGKEPPACPEYGTKKVAGMCIKRTTGRQIYSSHEGEGLGDSARGDG